MPAASHLRIMMLLILCWSPRVYRCGLQELGIAGVDGCHLGLPFSFERRLRLALVSLDCLEVLVSLNSLEILSVIRSQVRLMVSRPVPTAIIPPTHPRPILQNSPLLRIHHFRIQILLDTRIMNQHLQIIILIFLLVVGMFAIQMLPTLLSSMQHGVSSLFDGLL